MKRNRVWSTLLYAIIALLTLACGQSGTSTSPPATTSPVTKTTGATTATPIPTAATSTIAKPSYGGTISYRISAASNDVSNFDPFFNMTGGVDLWYETIAQCNFSLDPKIWPFFSSGGPPEYMKGRLAESWEIASDRKSYIFHIRKGVHWHNIPPVNGRELTSADIKYTYDRLLAKGEFAGKQAYNMASFFSQVDTITTPDKYTLVFNLKREDWDTLSFTTSGAPSAQGVVAREAIEYWKGDINDPSRQIGTGPFMVQDYVRGSSLTAVRNPNYWDVDENNPQNRLPYVDKIKAFAIPDVSTVMAAFRTAKIDLVTDLRWEEVDTLKKSNPEVKFLSRPANGAGMQFRVTEKPVDDVRVRAAMQMAIDIPRISETYYGGNASKVPFGNSGWDGFRKPFEEWPTRLKDEFTYNPEGAKKLLVDAGYPNGFKIDFYVGSNLDAELYQILQRYEKDIGVDMTFKIMEPAAFRSFYTAGKAQLWASSGTFVSTNPLGGFREIASTYVGNPGGYNDPEYDALVLKASQEFDLEARKKEYIDLDYYASGQHWRVYMPPYYTFIAHQPWLMGYKGQLPTAAGFASGGLPQRLWIDQNLKTSLGH